jgi:tetratricopeptide (TPR) repeat protein
MNANLLSNGLFGSFAGGLLLLGQAFWLWMLIDCMKSEGPRSEWRYVLLFGNVLGAIAYFVVRWLPHNELPLPPIFSRWKYGQKLWNAKAATHNIGNAHQFAVLGDVHLEMGDFADAQRAYQTALEKEPKNAIALWGTARIAMRLKDYLLDKTSLETLLKIDPDARLGDVSLLYGQALFELQDWETAKIH